MSFSAAARSTSRRWPRVKGLAFITTAAAEPSRRVISAGHCVTVREEKPAVDLRAGDKIFTLNLEKPASARLILETLAKSGEGSAI